MGVTSKSLRNDPIVIEKLTAWYDFQAPFYHCWRDNYANPLIKRVADLLGENKPLKVLDVGCGSGLFSIGIALTRPYYIFEGIDCSLGFLDIARKQAAKRSLKNVSFEMGDVYSLQNADKEFDSVVAAGLFPNLNEPLLALREIFRVLKTDGQFIVVEFDRSSMSSSTRLFFKVMIAGYRIFAAIMPRFRFAKKWNIESSTIDEENFLTDLRTSGFVLDTVIREAKYIIFVCRKH